MTPQSTPCPSPDRWKAMLKGASSDFDSSEWAAHLETCPVCQETVEKLYKGRHTWLTVAGHLRKTQIQGSGYREVMEKLRRQSPFAGVRIPGKAKAEDNQDASQGTRIPSVLASQAPSNLEQGSEPIRFVCPECKKRLSATPQAAGKRTKCPQCGTAIMIPDPQDKPIELGTAEKLRKLPRRRLTLIMVGIGLVVLAVSSFVLSRMVREATISDVEIASASIEAFAGADMAPSRLRIIAKIHPKVLGIAQDKQAKDALMTTSIVPNHFKLVLPGGQYRPSLGNLFVGAAEADIDQVVEVDGKKTKQRMVKFLPDGASISFPSDHEHLGAKGFVLCECSFSISNSEAESELFFQVKDYPRIPIKDLQVKKLLAKIKETKQPEKKKDYIAIAAKIVADPELGWTNSWAEIKALEDVNKKMQMEIPTLKGEGLLPGSRRCKRATPVEELFRKFGQPESRDEEADDIPEINPRKTTLPNGQQIFLPPPKSRCKRYHYGPVIALEEMDGSRNVVALRLRDLPVGFANLVFQAAKAGKN